MEQEVLEAVVDLNNRIFNVHALGDDVRFVLTTDGYNGRVEFLDVVIWAVDDDARIFYEDRDEYETYIACFRRRAQEVIDAVLRINMNSTLYTEED